MSTPCRVLLSLAAWGCLLGVTLWELHRTQLDSAEIREARSAAVDASSLVHADEQLLPELNADPTSSDRGRVPDANEDPRDFDDRTVLTFPWKLRVRLREKRAEPLTAIVPGANRKEAEARLRSWFSIHCTSVAGPNWNERSAFPLEFSLAQRRKPEWHGFEQYEPGPDFLTVGWVEVPEGDDITVGLQFGTGPIEWHRPEYGDHTVMFTVSNDELRAQLGELVVEVESGAQLSPWPATSIGVERLDATRESQGVELTDPAEPARFTLPAADYLVTVGKLKTLLGYEVASVQPGKTMHVAVATTTRAVALRAVGESLDRPAFELLVYPATLGAEAYSPWVLKLRGDTESVQLPLDDVLIRARAFEKRASAVECISEGSDPRSYELSLRYEVLCQFRLTSKECSPALMHVYDEQGHLIRRIGPYFVEQHFAEYLVPGTYRIVLIDELGVHCSGRTLDVRGDSCSFDL